MTAVLNKSHPHIVIVGGGITGLSAAHALSGRARVTLLESDSKLGGQLTTATLETPHGTAVVDGGAESFITRKPEAYELALELGLEAALVNPGAETKGVYLLRDGAMLEVPTSPPALLRSKLLSFAGKLRLLREPLVAPGMKTADESLLSFLERRIGTEAAGVFAPVMAGIYSSDPAEQSVLGSFPILRDLEANGGLVRGMLKRRKPKSLRPNTPIPRAISFSGGVSDLVDALEVKLRAQAETETKLNARVTSVSATKRITLESGETMNADAIILACPANVSEKLLQSSAPGAAQALAQLEHSSIGTLALVYPEAALAQHREKRGLMIPRGEGRAIDAVLFTSNKLPARATPGLTLIRVFFGAARPDLVAAPDDALLAVVRSELRDLLGLEGEPLAHHSFRWANSFPKMTVGHPDRVTAAERAMPSGAFLAGASYRGLGVPDCVRQGREAAARALKYAARLEENSAELVSA